MSSYFRPVHWVFCIVTANLAAASLGLAHPTESELKELLADHRLCESQVSHELRIDPARLGMSEAALRKSVAGLTQDPKPDETDSITKNVVLRFVRDRAEDPIRSEYELWQDRVFRIRWRLSRAFERPILTELRRRADACLGLPEYDQLFEAEPGSPKATLRRIAWIHDDRRIELRQLHPLRGGRVYLTVTKLGVLREIGASGLSGFPDPDRSESWWRRPHNVLRPATDEEKERLGLAFLRLLGQLDH